MDKFLRKNGKTSITKITQTQKFMEILSLAQLNYLILPNSVVIHVLSVFINFINFRKFSSTFVVFRQFPYFFSW